MKKTSKLLAFFLAVLMAFSVVPFSFAATEEACPLVYVPGIASSKLYYDTSDSSTEIVFPDTDEIKRMVTKKIIPALIIWSADKDAEKLAGVISDQFNIIFEGWFNNPDGTAKGNSGAIVNYPSSVSKNATVRFDWDWRGDPFEAAAELDKFIEHILEKSGCSKVALSSHSLGSVVILTYLSVYGDAKVSGIVYDTPVIDGINYIGEFMLGKFVTDGDALISTVNGIFSASENKALVESLMDVFALAGLSDDLSSLLNDVLDDVAPIIYRDTLVPLFARWPSIWTMAPAESVGEAMDYIFSELLTDEESLKLKAKVEKYNSEVRVDRYNTLLDFDENGRLAVISRYGSASLPISSEWDTICDGVVDTASSSLGATTADFGKSFDAAYLEGKDEKFISPDKTVDASTCLFPEKTWFVKNINHANAEPTRQLYSSLLFGEEEATCENYNLPRFVIYDAESGNISVDTSEPSVKTKKSPLQILFNFIKALFERLLNFLKK